MKVRIREIVRYGGHSVGANRVVSLTLKASYSELTKSMELMQALNNDIKIKAKGEGKPIELGLFRVKQVVFDGDGTSTLKFNGVSDYIEMDNLNALPGLGNDKSEFAILAEADIELEDEEEIEE